MYICQDISVLAIPYLVARITIYCTTLRAMISVQANLSRHFGAVTRISRPVKLLYREELLGTTNPSVSTDRPKECDVCSVAGLQCKPVRDDVRTPAIQGHTVCQHRLVCQLPAEESCW